MEDKTKDNNTAEDRDAESASQRPSLSEKQRRELWLYIGVSITAVELLIAVGALLYGFMGSPAQRAFVFPWLSWGAFAALAPAMILLLVHSADVGLFRAPSGAASEQEWQKLLPERLQKLYRVIKGAPVVAVLVGVMALAATLLTLEGALSALKEFGAALKPHVPFIVGGLAGLAAVIVVAVAWLNYRTRRLIAEYEFRREVLEKTGVIIVDKGSTPLPPGGVGDVPYALVAGEEAEALKALPPPDLASEPSAEDPASSPLSESSSESPSESPEPPQTAASQDAQSGPGKTA